MKTRNTGVAERKGTVRERDAIERARWYSVLANSKMTALEITVQTNSIDMRLPSDAFCHAGPSSGLIESYTKHITASSRAGKATNDANGMELDACFLRDSTELCAAAAAREKPTPMMLLERYMN